MTNRRYNIAVILHLYFPELWDDINAYLKNLEGKFDLYVSIPFQTEESIVTSIKASHPTARVIRFENRGRDVAPFIELYSAIVPLYEFICKIHSKRSTRMSHGNKWRQELYEELLGSISRVKDILSAFERNSKIGMIGPAGHSISIRSASITGFRAYQNILTHLAERVGVNRIDQLDYHFFSGTMFWFRSEALKPILDLNITQGDFEPENGAVDGTLAHALERFFPVAVFASGYQIYDTGHLAPDSLSDLDPIYDTPKKHHQDSDRIWLPPKTGTPGVNLIGPVEFINGVSLSARGYASSLMHSGIKLNVIPWKTGFERLNRIEVEYPENDLQPINLVHLNLDLLVGERLLDRGPLAEIVNADRYNICIPYWELSEILPEWHEILNRFDEIWCASSFMAKAFSAGPRPVRVVRPSIEWKKPPQLNLRSDFSLPEEKFIFFYAADIGSIMGRKNPMAMVHAYTQEFMPEEGACCLVKINYANRRSHEIREILSLSKHRTDVIFMDKLLEEHRMHALFEQIDCYVSPHRSEGLGLTILEAMSACKPVIATPYGGVTDFVNGKTAFPIEFRLAQVGEGNFPYPPNYVWADPSISSLRGAMRRVFINRTEAGAIARNGKTLSEDLFSLQQTSFRIHEAINGIWNGTNRDSFNQG